MAPVAKRLTMSAAGSTSSIGTGLRPSASAERMRNMPRMVISCSDWSLICLANARYLSRRVAAHGMLQIGDDVSARHTCASPRTR